MSVSLEYGWIARLLDAIYPPCCVLCGVSGRPGLDLCHGCEAELPWIGCPCRRCALPLSRVTGPGHCGACLRRPPPWDFAESILQYRYPVDHLLQALKFRRRLCHARVLAALMGSVLSRREWERPQLLLPVPLHPRRERERGFNQSREIARPLARQLGIPVAAPRLCRRVRATQEQSGLNASQRRSNVRGAFALCAALPAPHVAIVDDVHTTGHTLAELSRVLRQGGAETIEVWTCARAAYAGG